MLQNTFISVLKVFFDHAQNYLKIESNQKIIVY